MTQIQKNNRLPFKMEPYEVDVDWLAQLQSQNSKVADVAIAARPYYNPTLADLDQGIQVLHFDERDSPTPQTEGAGDSYVLVQEYLQGLVAFCKRNPSQGELVAQFLFDETDLRLSFLMTDCNPNTTEDQDAKAELLARIENVKKKSLYSIGRNKTKLLRDLVTDLSANGSPIHLYDRQTPEADLKTTRALEVWQGANAQCVSVRAMYEAIAVYAFGGDVQVQSYELFGVNGGWKAHSFMSVQFGADESSRVFVDPLGIVLRAYNFGPILFTPAQMPESLMAVPLSDLEEEALYYINPIRHDRAHAKAYSVPLQMPVAERKKNVDLALLLAPTSVFVLIEAYKVYNESGLTVQAQTFLEQAKQYAPSVVNELSSD